MTMASIKRINELHRYLQEVMSNKAVATKTRGELKWQLVKLILSHMWDCPTEDCGVAHNYLEIEGRLIKALNGGFISYGIVRDGVNFINAVHMY